jgi:hypothetical protein
MAQRRYAGRPTTAARKGEKATLGIRASASLKTRLDRAAKENARSLSQESEIRLEQSFRDDEQIPAALRRIYGAQLAGLLLLLGEVLRDVGSMAGFLTTLTLAGRDEWMDLPYPYRQACTAVATVMLSLRPEGEPVKPTQFGSGFLSERVAQDLGATVPIPFLQALADPAEFAISERLINLASELRPMLGAAVDRITPTVGHIWGIDDDDAGEDPDDDPPTDEGTIK